MISLVPAWVLMALSASIMWGVSYATIHAKNASYASLIEITYPFFVFLFSWLLFRQANFSWSVVLGGLLIFCGSAIILLKAK